jgi:hypothetical protein
MSMDNLTAGMSALGMPTNTTEAELVSEMLRARLGPMQLSGLQDATAAGRFFSWNAKANNVHQRILRRHMRYVRIPCAHTLYYSYCTHTLCPVHLAVAHAT